MGYGEVETGGAGRKNQPKSDPVTDESSQDL